MKVKLNPKVTDFDTILALWWGTTWRLAVAYLGFMLVLGVLIRVFEFLY